VVHAANALSQHTDPAQQIFTADLWQRLVGLAAAVGRAVCGSHASSAIHFANRAGFLCADDDRAISHLEICRHI